MKTNNYPYELSAELFKIFSGVPTVEELQAEQERIKKELEKAVEVQDVQQS